MFRIEKRERKERRERGERREIIKTNRDWGKIWQFQHSLKKLNMIKL
jgi:hypothetical protein